ncbi:hypothetical protein BDV32DRAFT_136191 [Aspergillus pseudonomiae]|uniref:Uncharacterized protein n=1 Tax=Aspergillus pseudonomiae TaxID=1506151 RepID=A0A5N7DQA3_9EURO|nr:uncharacterized protein BDV37DRAFT_268256 [Aspergillus pseudonomiae]KAB8263132.1 hypothetical protein BDV32DRAFT_136191 [Aspergillus pseudonomiae]KAE8408621.1 hypothetical protein BDV37DRAFT_268256 [Aspergillus pseudonomiae]
MAPPGVFFSLRVSQAIYAVATFALLLSIAMFSSCISLVAVAYMAYGSLSPSQGLAKACKFTIHWLVSFVSLVAFICLAKFLAGASECDGSLLWTAATTLIGIDISKDNRRANAALQEKLKALEDN